jgi:hypothetical protein
MGNITRTNFGISKITRFTNAQILALPTTTPTLVAAITGRIIMPWMVSYTLHPWVADYTNIDGGSKIGVNIGAVFTNPAFVASALLAQGKATVIWTEVGREFDYLPYDYNALLSLPLKLTVTNAAAGNFTGGNATQVLTVQVFYNVLNI